MFYLILAFCHALTPQADADLGVPFVVTQVPTAAGGVSTLGWTGTLDQGPHAYASTSMSPVGPEGSKLVLVAPPARRGEPQRLEVLAKDFHSACDPDVSFDATRLLFAAKRRPDDGWNIYEMALDGGLVRQITRGLGNCRSPVYQGSLYTLKPIGVPSAPEYQLTFVADTGAVTECGDSAATSLYCCKFDGSSVRRLTFNLSADFGPRVGPDGRLVFASRQCARLDDGPGGYTGLFAINIDGSDFALFAPPPLGQDKPVRHMPCVTTKGLVVFVEAGATARDGGGSLGSVSLRRPLHSYRPLTSADQDLFHSPSPLPDGRVLVSRRSRAGADTYGVYVLDPDTGRIEPVFDDPQWHDIQATAMHARPEPDGRSTAVPEDPGASATTGVFYCLNVYTSDLKPGWLPAGSVKRLRVLEGVAAQSGSRRAGAQCAGIAPLAQRRILGEIPVEQDGSFSIEIPANTPIELQTLDAEGMALRSCGWIWAKDYARQGCIGCHEDPELTPQNAMVEAVKRPSIKLTLPAERRRTVDFRRDVMPIIADKCASCHANHPTLRLTAEMAQVSRPQGEAQFNRSYESLLEGAESGFGKYVHAGKARTSPLIWNLFGRDTSRPWDRPVADKQIHTMPPAGASPLSAHERKTFVEWIDMGAFWDGIP